jgi:hypothetical protein
MINDGSTVCEESEDELTVHDEDEYNRTLCNDSVKTGDEGASSKKSGTSAKKPFNSCDNWVIQNIRNFFLSSPLMTIWRKKKTPREMMKRVKEERKCKN